MSAQTMKASYLLEAGVIRLEEVEKPTPGPGQVLVRITAVGVCGSDVHYFTHGGIGDHILRQPMILGHEPAGLVEGVGPGVDRSWVGKRVSIEPGVPDGTCSYCLSGHYNLCPNMVFFATPPVNGAFAEYIVHPVGFVYELPDNVSYDAGALIEPLSVGLWANRLATTKTGDRVLITGAGPVGILAAQAARVAGAAEIVVSDISAHRREIASQFGATTVVDPTSTDLVDLDAHVFIDCSGASAAISAGIRALRPAGRAVLVGLGSDSVSIPMGLIQDRELTVQGNFRYSGTWPIGIALAARGLVELDSLVTGHFTLEDVDKALTVDAESRAIKTVVVP
jgi:L-iditol 2-dehydrogenase